MVHLQEQKKPKEEEPKEEPKKQTSDEKLEELTAKIKQMEISTQQEKELIKLNRDLQSNINEHELTKTDPEMAANISLLTAAKMNINPRLNMQETFAELVLQQMERDKRRDGERKNRTSDNNLARANLSGLSSGGDSGPTVDKSKVWTADDLIGSNRSRTAFRELLEQLQE